MRRACLYRAVGDAAQDGEASPQLTPGGNAIQRYRGLGGVGRSRAGDGGDVVDQGRVALVADGADHRDPQHRHGAAEGLVAEGPEVGEELPPPRVTTIASTCGWAARSWIAAVIAGAAWRS